MSRRSSRLRTQPKVDYNKEHIYIGPPLPSSSSTFIAPSEDDQKENNVEEEVDQNDNNAEEEVEQKNKTTLCFLRLHATSRMTDKMINWHQNVLERKLDDNEIECEVVDGRKELSIPIFVLNSLDEAVTPRTHMGPGITTWSSGILGFIQGYQNCLWNKWIVAQFTNKDSDEALISAVGSYTQYRHNNYQTMDDLRVEISLSRTLVYKLSTIVDLWMLDGKASNAFLCHVAWGSDIGEPFHQKLVPSTAQSFANQFNLDLSDECIKLIVDRIIIGGKYRMRNATRLDG
eukprot:1000903_1